MKCVIILALFALASANSLYGVQKEIHVDGDRKILIKVPGKTIRITKPEDDDKGVEVFVKDQDKFIKKVQIDKDKNIVKHIVMFRENGGLEDSSEEDTSRSSEEKEERAKRQIAFNTFERNQQMKDLCDIFRKYEGLIGEQSFYQLLKEVKQVVDEGKVHPIIYKTLKDLEIKSTFFGRQLGRKDFSSEELDTSLEGENKFDTRDWDTKERDRGTRQIQWIQDLVQKNRVPLTRDFGLGYSQKPRFNDLLRETDDSTLLKDQEIKQLMSFENILKIEREISHEKLRCRQFELQQHFLNRQKHQVKLQLLMTEKRGVISLKLREVLDVLIKLNQQEKELLRIQIDCHRKIRELQDRLIEEKERLLTELETEQNEIKMKTGMRGDMDFQGRPQFWLPFQRIDV